MERERERERERQIERLFLEMSRDGRKQMIKKSTA
jgi:hypothetical protein